MNMRKVMKIFGLTLVVAILLVSCKPEVPRGLIQPDDMEQLLYDYHLADGLAEQAKGDAAANIVAYRAAVLMKYKVTQAEFDSSMVYYMRHTDQMHTIYEHIAERMQNDARNMGSTVSGGTVSARGDSTDVWKMEPSVVLMPNEPFNLYTYNLKADSTFHKGDEISFMFRSSFIFQDGMRDGVVLLAVTFKNDSIASTMTRVSGSQSMSITIRDDKELGIKEIRGFILLNKNNMANSSSTTLQMAAFYDLHLLRVHQRKEVKKATPADGTIPSDSMRQSMSASDPNPEPGTTPPSGSSGTPPSSPAVVPANLKPMQP